MSCGETSHNIGRFAVNFAHSVLEERYAREDYANELRANGATGQQVEAALRDYDTRRNA